MTDRPCQDCGLEVSAADWRSGCPLCLRCQNGLPPLPDRITGGTVRRAWLYRGWDGRRLLLSGDEYDRRTLLIRLWGTRAVVFALWTVRA